LLKNAGAVSGCTDLINDGLSLCFCMCTLTETKAVVMAVMEHFVTLSWTLPGLLVISHHYLPSFAEIIIQLF